MATLPTPASATGADVLLDAYNTLTNCKDAPGKREQTFDNLGNRITSTGTSPTLSFVNSFYEANKSTIDTAVAGITCLDHKAIEGAVSGFAESAKVVMNGLDALGQVHPFIGVAVVAFKLVVTLDMTRRENNQKVMAVKVQMQQMMCTLFQLRRIKDPDEIGPDGVILSDRMQPLMEQIARDIKECGSACDVYLKKSFIAKTLKSKIYEGRLAEYAARFMDYRDQLDKSLTVHIALGIDAANEKLDVQTSKLQCIEDKLDMLQLVFRKLDTPREKEIMEFIDEHGGAKHVINHNELLENLVKKSGETMANLTDKSSNKRNDIDSVKERLNKELAEDLNSVMKRNFVLFDRKLEIQGRNIADAVERQGQYIVTALSAGTHDKIKDTDLQNLWREMGWKGSVKARHFVLALRDYFTDQFTTSPHPGHQTTLTIEIPSPITASDIGEYLVIPEKGLHGFGDDQWALEYINVAHLQSILEAIDDDGTGFISIKEANTFAIERPKNWSLLAWIAFWAKGWEMSLADYENRIFLILREMNELVHEVLRENRYHVEKYLLHQWITGIEVLLRSTKTAKDYGCICSELASLTEVYTTGEEERLQKNLENIGYDLDSPATVTIITGPGRIERFLFPLLFLTLKRHLEVFHCARKHVVDSEEFSHMAITLGSIFGVVNQRIDSLGAIYKQVHVDLNSHLENFALGMFHDLSANSYSLGTKESLIPFWTDTSKTKNEAEESKFIVDPESAKPIFSFDPASLNNYQGVWLDWPSHSFDTDPFIGVLNGYWAGYLWSIQGDSMTCTFGSIQLRVDVDPDDETKLKGVGITFSGSLDVHGRRRLIVEEGNAVGEEIDLVMSFDDGYSMRLIGIFDSEQEQLLGSWSQYNERDDAKAAFDSYPFGAEIKNTEGGGEEKPENVNGGEEALEEAEGREEKDMQAQECTGDCAHNTDATEEAPAGGEIEAQTSDIKSVPSDEVTVQNNPSPGDSGDSLAAVADGGNAVQANPQNSGEEVEAEVIRKFTFRRTPVEISSYRELLFGDENKARARWAFARNAVLYFVRRQLWSWGWLKSWNADRRMFLDCYKRNWLLASCNFMTPEPLTATERQSWYFLKYRLPPANIRLCVETAAWSLFRLPFHYGINCDGCSHRLLDDRYICLTCIDPEMSNSFDLCSQCMDKPAERDDFTHSVDHTLIKCRRNVQSYEFVWLINEARLMTTRLKKTLLELSSQEEGRPIGEHDDAGSSRSELLCGYCAKPVRVPCWICITCARETYICMDCEGKELPILKDGPGSPTHRPECHPLLRLHNLEPARFQREKPDPTVVRINALESSVNQKFEALEAIVGTRLSALETKVEERLAVFESLLQRIALQLRVLPDSGEQLKSENGMPDGVNLGEADP